jgi:undecaprenyl-diphosphatase
VSVAGEVKSLAVSVMPRWRRFANNATKWLRLLVRHPRATARPAWRAPARIAAWGVPALAAIAATMVIADRAAIVAVQGLPLWVGDFFNVLTDYGTSDWFLVPIAVVLVLIAAFVPPALPRMSRLVLVALSVRLGFVFTAIAVPGLFATIVKRLIGRARPFLAGDASPFHYLPFSWRPDYASLPSGHATNVFAALIAIGLVAPRLRAPMLVYALVIATSRVIVLAHHPSDVLAGALVGTVGALMVRDWFAARALGFVVAPDGSVRKLPGPSLRRLMAVARQFAAA